MSKSALIGGGIFFAACFLWVISGFAQGKDSPPPDVAAIQVSVAQFDRSYKNLQKLKSAIEGRKLARSKLLTKLTAAEHTLRTIRKSKSVRQRDIQSQERVVDKLFSELGEKHKEVLAQRKKAQDASSELKKTVDLVFFKIEQVDNFNKLPIETQFKIYNMVFVREEFLQRPGDGQTSGVGKK